MINAWNEYGQSDDDYFSVLSVRTIYDKNGLESKKLLQHKPGLGDDCKYEHTSRLSKPCKFFKTKRVARDQTKIPEPKNNPVEKRIKDLCCGFTDATINILGKIIVRTQSNGWISEETQFFITGGHERIDNLPKLGIEVT